jgi:hypothetical protein
MPEGWGMWVSALGRRIRENPAVMQILLMFVVVSVGWTAVTASDIHPQADSTIYLYSVQSLLAIGLYGSTYGIARSATKDLGTVVQAVTLGVLLKAALIGAVMALVAMDWRFFLLGIAVAQIDPLSVAVLRGRSRMSERAKSLLSAWAAFDDPVTVVLTIAVSSAALGVALGGLGGSGLSSYLGNLAWNAAFVAGTGVVWWCAKRLHGGGSHDSPVMRRVWQAVAVLGFLALVVLAVRFGWLLGLAFIGLFYRPSPADREAVDRAIEILTQVAWLGALFVLGTTLVEGAEIPFGLLLGVLAFVAQFFVAILLTRQRRHRGAAGKEPFSMTDRIRLGLGQQNGITAIILALILYPYFPRAVAIIGPAVFVVNVLNVISNAWWDRLEARTEQAGVRPPESGPTTMLSDRRVQSSTAIT